MSNTNPTENKEHQETDKSTRSNQTHFGNLKKVVNSCGFLVRPDIILQQISTSFSHSWLTTWLATSTPRRVSHVEQELFTILRQLSSPLCLVDFVLLNRSFLYVVMSIIICLVFFLLFILLSVFLRITVSDNPFGIFKRFLQIPFNWHI